MKSEPPPYGSEEMGGIKKPVAIGPEAVMWPQYLSNEEDEDSAASIGGHVIE